MTNAYFLQTVLLAVARRGEEHTQPNAQVFVGATGCGELDVDTAEAFGRKECVVRDEALLGGWIVHKHESFGVAKSDTAHRDTVARVLFQIHLSIHTWGASALATGHQQLVTLPTADGHTLVRFPLLAIRRCRGDDVFDGHLSVV